METKDWNLQTRQQLVKDLCYTCTQDYELVEVLVDELVWLLKDNEERLDTLDSYCDEAKDLIKRG